MDPKKNSKPKNEIPTEQKQSQRDDLQELTDTLQRLQAEFENFKKRTEREQDLCVQRANRGLLQKLLPVLDDFERAVEHVEDEGIRNIYGKFKGILGEEGLQKVQMKTFDPRLHQACMVEPAAKKEEDNTITEVFEAGYMLKDQVLRHAKVKVAKYGDDTNG